MEWLVRAGFVARALTYGLIGCLALALTLGAGTGGKSPNQQGALTLVASAPLGKVALVAVIAGLLAYAGWKLVQGLRGRGPEGGGGADPLTRVGNVGGGIAYLALAALAIRVLAGAGGNESKAPSHATAGVLGWPGGTWLVGIAGVGLIAGAGYQLWYGVNDEFARQTKTGEMSATERRTFLRLGRTGLTARALVLAIVGWFLLDAGLSYNPHKAVGVDGALARLHHEPLGPWLTAIVAIGLLVFAAFSLFEARYRRL